MRPVPFVLAAIGVAVVAAVLATLFLGGSGPVAPQIPTPTHTHTLGPPTLGPPTLGPPTLTPTPLPTGPQPLRSIGIERAFPNLKFGDLTNLVQPDDGLDNMVVTEKSGRILIFPNDDDATRVDMFMDLRDRVSYTPAPPFHEEGLLGLVFDPDYRNNGYF